MIPSGGFIFSDVHCFLVFNTPPELSARASRSLLFSEMKCLPGAFSEAGHRYWPPPPRPLSSRRPVLASSFEGDLTFDMSFLWFIWCCWCFFYVFWGVIGNRSAFVRIFFFYIIRFLISSFVFKLFVCILFYSFFLSIYLFW